MRDAIVPIVVLIIIGVCAWNPPKRPPAESLNGKCTALKHSKSGTAKAGAAGFKSNGPTSVAE